METLDSLFNPCDSPLALWVGVAFGLALVAIFLAIVLSGMGRKAWGAVVAVAAVFAVYPALQIAEALESRRACYESIRPAEEPLPVRTALDGYYTGWLTVDGTQDYVHLWLDAPPDSVAPVTDYLYRLRRGVEGQEGTATLDAETGVLNLEGLGELSATEGPDGIVRLGREEPAARLDRVGLETKE